MDYEEEELMEEKSFKASGAEDDDSLLDEDVDDTLGPGPDEDFNFEDEEEQGDSYGSGDSY